MHSPDPEAQQLIRDNLARLDAIWTAMVDEPQDPQTLARIAANGKRTDKD